MVLRSFFISLCCFFTSLIHAGDLTQNQLHQFEIGVAKKLNREKLPGACIAVVGPQDVFYKRCFGEANNVSGEWLSPNHVFQLASMSKTFISLLIADYVHAGVFDYDDPINNYVKTPLANDVRISDLLAHRSGYKSQSAPIENGYSYAVMKRKVFKQKMKNCESKKCHSYNNIGYNLLVDLLEEVSGKSINVLLQELIFMPAGMQTASSGEQGYMYAAHQAHPHMPDKKGDYRPHTLSTNYYKLIGSAGLNASLNDMISYMQYIMNHPEYFELFKPQIETKALLWSFDDPRVKSAKYGYGWRLMNYRNVEIVWHPGWLNGMRPAIVFIPEYDVSLIVLNHSNACVWKDIMFSFIDLLNHSG